MPSLSPSILTPGQFAKKYLASSQDFICVQYFLPSHLKEDCSDEVTRGFSELSELGETRVGGGELAALLFWVESFF